MARTKQPTELAYNITYVGPGYETIIVATVFGADNALQLGALIAAGSQLNTVYAAISPCETELLAVWNSGGRTGYTRTEEYQVHELDRPDGPCEVTRWLEQQFGKGSTNE